MSEITKNLAIHGQRERDVLAQALNTLQEQHSDGSRTAEAAAELKERLPPHSEFEIDDEPEAGNELQFFDDADTEFKQVTDTSWMGVREAGDIKAVRQFKLDVSAQHLRITTSYHFGAEQVDERTTSRPVDGVYPHTNNPTWHATVKDRSLEEYCRSIHAGSPQKDERRVEQILAENPQLRPHIWNQYNG